MAHVCDSGTVIPGGDRGTGCVDQELWGMSGCIGGAIFQFCRRIESDAGESARPGLSLRRLLQNRRIERRDWRSRRNRLKKFGGAYRLIANAIRLWTQTCRGLGSK